jgi:hypothetical protein
MISSVERVYGIVSTTLYVRNQKKAHKFPKFSQQRLRKLEMNNRLPTKEIVWHLYKELEPNEIRELRNGVFRYLANHGLEAITNIELTRGDYKKANNRVHFHMLTDDERSEDELKFLIIKPCIRRGLVMGDGKDFGVDFRELLRPDTYFAYFTKFSRVDKEWCEKHNKDRVLLFQPKLGLYKFLEIKKGTWFSPSKAALWKNGQ